MKMRIYLSLSWLVSFGVWIRYSISWVNQKKIKSSRKKNMSFERALDFDQWITFSENYKPMRVSLWLFYKSTENNCCLQLFSEFIQTQKRYPTPLDKICILTWKLIVISSQTFPCELNSQRTYFLQNISYPSLSL